MIGEAGEAGGGGGAGPAAGPPVDPRLRIHVQFHPDRPYRGRTVLDALAEGGVYRSQFVTGISNGGLIAYPDGGRHDPQDLKRVWHSVARFG